MRPPRLADMVLHLLLPADVAIDVIGDLHEEFSRYKLPEAGPLRSILWYWGQALSTGVRLFRGRPRAAAALQETGALLRHFFADLGSDLRLSVRRTVRAPVASLSTVAILAFGIGAAATAFSAIDPILLEPVPYASPEDLLVVETISHVDDRGVGVSPPEFRAYRDGSATLQELAAVWPTAAILSRGGSASPVRAELVTPNLFSMLGVAPALGRDFRASDVPDAVGYVALVSHDAWTRLFSSDPALVGREITLDSDPIEVIGIMPPQVTWTGPGGRPVDFWVPMELAEGGRFDSPAIRDLAVIGRLREGFTVSDAQEDLDRIGRGGVGGPGTPPKGRKTEVDVQSLEEAVMGRAQPVLLLALLAVGLVLAAAVTSVASMRLVDGAERAREFAVRLAVGGRRGLLIRQLFLESLLVGTGGAVGAVVVAFWSTSILRELAAGRIPGAGQIEVSGSVVALLVGLAVVVVLLVGLWPALRCTEIRAAGALQGKGLQSPLILPSRRGLVGLQTAVAVVLFVGAGVVFQSYRSLSVTDPGFEAERILTLTTWLPVPNDPSAGAYADPERRVAFFEEVLRGMTSHSEVEGAAVTSLLPLSGTFATPIFLPGSVDPSGRPAALAEYRMVSESYFHVMGIDVVRGRTFRRSDGPNAGRVAVVNAAFAGARFGDEDPIGRRVCIGVMTANCLDVVGVVENVRHGELGELPREAIYTALRQNGQAAVAMAFVLKTSGPPNAVGMDAVAAVHRVDPDIPAFSLMPMSDVVQMALGREQLLTILFAVISLVTGALASMGIYGVVSTAVTRRHLEMGIRLSLGGGRVGLLKLLLGEGLWLGLLGVLAGLPAAFVLGGFMASSLSHADSVHPGIVAGAALLAVSIVAASSFVPALRAMGINPGQALRAE